MEDSCLFYLQLYIFLRTCAEAIGTPAIKAHKFAFYDNFDKYLGYLSKIKYLSLCGIGICLHLTGTKFTDVRYISLTISNRQTYRNTSLFYYYKGGTLFIYFALFSFLICINASVLFKNFYKRRWYFIKIQIVFISI